MDEEKLLGKYVALNYYTSAPYYIDYSSYNLDKDYWPEITIKTPCIPADQLIFFDGSSTLPSSFNSNFYVRPLALGVGTFSIIASLLALHKHYFKK